MTGPKASGRGLFVVLMPTLECNLDCAYCFEPHLPGRWDIAQTRRVLDQVFELAEAEGFDQLRVHWQGGEVLLLGVDFWGAALTSCVELGEQRGVTVEQHMQTNLTLYDSAMAPAVRRFLGGRLGTSFDGTSARRFPPTGDATFQDRWLQKRDQAEGDGLEVGVLALLDRITLQEGADAYLGRMRDELGIRRLRLALPFQQSASRGRGYWLDPERTGAFLSDAYRWWSRRGGDEHLHLKPFRWLTDQLSHGRSDEPGLCTFSDSCADVGLAIVPSGEVMLCDSFSGSDVLPSYGNVFRESLGTIFHGAQRRQMRARCASLMQDRCCECRYLSICYGGCLVRARPLDGTAPPGFMYCDTYRALFETVEEAVQSSSQL